MLRVLSRGVRGPLGSATTGTAFLRTLDGRVERFTEKTAGRLQKKIAVRRLRNLLEIDKLTQFCTLHYAQI